MNGDGATIRGQNQVTGDGNIFIEGTGLEEESAAHIGHFLALTDQASGINNDHGCGKVAPSTQQLRIELQGECSGCHLRAGTKHCQVDVTDKDHIVVIAGCVAAGFHIQSAIGGGEEYTVADGGTVVDRHRGGRDVSRADRQKGAVAEFKTERGRG